MLHCNMHSSLSLQLGLEDLLADLRHARRGGDLGRLALIAYCDVRRWARQAGEPAIADHAAAMFSGEPHASREAFLEAVDTLLFELVQAKSRRDERDAAVLTDGQHRVAHAGAARR